jgi:hypothetical protein
MEKYHNDIFTSIKETGVLDNVEDKLKTALDNFKKDFK